MNRESLNYLLARFPRIYSYVLRARKHTNFEKLTFLNIIRNGDVVFDIGANRGYYTLLFSHLAGKHGQVHAFEPVLPTYNQLTTNIAKGKRFNNVHLNHLAVSDKSGAVNLYLPGNDDGQASLSTHNAGSWKTATTVTTFESQAIRLDDYVSLQNLTRLDFVKCDVEGAEMLVLKGMADTLSKYSPMLHLEVALDWARQFGYAPMDIVRCLSAFGYSQFHLIADGIYHVKEPTAKLSAEHFYANLLCTIPRLHGARVKGLPLSTYLRD
jgi:FkbM family methyltransferase